jgi:hypothetical protein
MCNQRMKVFFNLIDDPHFNIYRCSEVKVLRDLWLKEFRKVNHSDRVEKTRVDTAFEMYKQNIDDFIKGCKDEGNKSD